MAHPTVTTIPLLPIKEQQRNAALFLDGRKGHNFCINYYAFNINTPDQAKIADEVLKKSDCSSSWPKGSGKIKCYKAPYDSFDKDTAREFLIKKLSLLNHFETVVRSQW